MRLLTWYYSIKNIEYSSVGVSALGRGPRRQQKPRDYVQMLK